MARNTYKPLSKNIPYTSIKLTDYNISVIMSRIGSFEEKVNERIKKLESQGIDPRVHPGYLTSLVDEYMVRLMHEAEVLHNQNLIAIGDGNIRQQAEKNEAEILLEGINEQIEKTKEEYDETSDLFDKFSPISIRSLREVLKKTGGK